MSLSLRSLIRSRSFAGHRLSGATAGYQSPSSSRRAAATVELAVCLPVLVLLVFGSIEAASFVFLKQSLQVAAYEGSREAIRAGRTGNAAVDRARAILDSRQVRQATVRFPAVSPDLAERGQQVVIEVSAPTSSNSPLAGQWVPNRTLTARVVMLKE